MSSEKIISTEKENIITLKSPKVKEKVFSGRVDIYNLLTRIRKEKEKDNFTNTVLFGLLIVLITSVGIISSL